MSFRINICTGNKTISRSDYTITIVYVLGEEQLQENNNAVGI
jgi:hypothetical protein